MGRKMFKAVGKELNQTQKMFYFMSLASFYNPPFTERRCLSFFQFLLTEGWAHWRCFMKPLVSKIFFCRIGLRRTILSPREGRGGPGEGEAATARFTLTNCLPLLLFTIGLFVQIGRLKQHIISLSQNVSRETYCFPFAK